MKKLLLFMLVAALAFVGCSDDDVNQTITVGKGQTVDLVVVEKGQKLIIEGTVKTLTVNGGDVVVEKDGKVTSINVPNATDPTPTITIKAPYGNIGTITNTGKAKIYWTAYSANDLRAILAKPAITNSGALLGSNVTSEYIADLPLGSFVVGTFDQVESLLYKPTAYDGYILDGQSFTIQGAAAQNVLFIAAHNVVVKNLTVSQTSANKKDHANNGIQVYWVNGLKLENVTATNCGRAGMIINASTATATDFKASANAWGSVNVSLPISPSAGAKDPEFTMLNDGNLEDNFKIYVDASSFDNHKVTVPSGWTNSDVTTSGKVVRAYYPKGQAPVPVS